MGSGASRPPWHESAKLRSELESIEINLYNSDLERTGSAELTRFNDYIKAINEGLNKRNVCNLKSLAVVEEILRHVDRSDDVTKKESSRDRVLNFDDVTLRDSDAASVGKFEVICTLEGGEDLSAQLVGKKQTGFQLKKKGEDQGGCWPSSSGGTGSVPSRREIIRQTTIGHLGTISADRTLTTFLSNIETALRGVKLMADLYQLERDRSSIRLDVHRQGKIGLTIYLVPHYDIAGDLYYPEPYGENETSITWIRSYYHSDVTRLRSVSCPAGSKTKCCQEKVLRLLRGIIRSSPELKNLGTASATEVLLLELDRRKNWEWWSVEHLGLRLTDVLENLLAALTAGKLINKERKFDYFAHLSSRDLETASGFLQKVLNSEIEFYKLVIDRLKKWNTRPVVRNQVAQKNNYKMWI